MVKLTQYHERRAMNTGYLRSSIIWVNPENVFTILESVVDGYYVVTSIDGQSFNTDEEGLNKLKETKND